MFVILFTAEHSSFERWMLCKEAKSCQNKKLKTHSNVTFNSIVKIFESYVTLVATKSYPDKVLDNWVLV